MKITLNHLVELKSGFALLEMEVLDNAEGMAEFLESLQKGETLFKEALQNRAEKEMQRLGFLDHNNKPTKNGKRLIETKQRYIKEYGKYEIEFSQDDKIFDNRIFRVERVEANDRQVELINIDLSKITHLLIDDKGNITDKIKIVKKSVDVEIKPNTSFIEYARFYEINMDGKILANQEMLNKNEMSGKEFLLNTKTFIQKYEQALSPNWDRKNLAYKIDIDELDEFLEKKYIKDIRKLTAKYNAENFEFSNLALYPKEESVARRILTLCLLKDLNETYLTKNELDSKIETYINYKGLNEFLKTESKESYIKDLESELKKEKDKKIFWHYNAIMDLYPKSDLLPNIIKTIVLEDKESLSYYDFVEKIIQNRNIEALIYIDKYFKNKYQNKRAELIVEGFNVEQYLIITDKNNIESLLAMNLKTEEFHPMPHDRYLILKINNDIEVWSITQSDFLRFECKADEIRLDTKGIAEGCVISNVDNLLILTDKLRQIVENFMELKS